MHTALKHFAWFALGALLAAVLFSSRSEPCATTSKPVVKLT